VVVARCFTDIMLPLYLLTNLFNDYATVTGKQKQHGPELSF